MINFNTNYFYDCYDNNEDIQSYFTINTYPSEPSKSVSKVVSLLFARLNAVKGWIRSNNRYSSL